MKKIITLYGAGERGKTQTLNALIDLLKTKAGIGVTAHNPKYDRKESIVYNGLKISICTAGDNERELLENTAFFNQERCDIAISAARTYGKTHEVLKNCAKQNGVSIDFVRKTVDRNNSNAVNLAQANALLDLI